MQTQRSGSRGGKFLEWAKQQPGTFGQSFADSRTYSELTRILAWDGEVECAEEVVREMWFRDLSVDNDTVFAVMAAYAKAGRWEVTETDEIGDQAQLIFIYLVMDFRDVLSISSCLYLILLMSLMRWYLYCYCYCYIAINFYGHDLRC